VLLGASGSGKTTLFRVLYEESERRMYELLMQRLPDAAIISNAHKSSVLLLHERQVVIEPPPDRKHDHRRDADAPGESVNSSVVHASIDFARSADAKLSCRGIS
jgi:ABC-type uncharacterized transport system fused permease/ATPase subunit